MKMNEGIRSSKDHNQNILNCVSGSVGDQHSFELLVQLESKCKQNHGYTSPSVEATKLTKKIFGSGVKCLQSHQNGNLLALGYIFMIIAHRDHEMDQLKTLILDQLDQVPESSSDLLCYGNSVAMTQQQIYNLTKYMMINLNSHKPELGIYEIMDKFYLGLQVMSMFFRSLLQKLKYADAANPDKKLKTDDIYAILSEYFDLNCQNNANTYFFNDHGLFISFIEPNQYVFGRYYENQTMYLQYEKLIKKNTISYLHDLNQKSHLQLSISGFILANDQSTYFSNNISTPTFGQEILKQSLSRKKQELKLVNLTEKELHFKSEIINEEEYQEMKSIMKESTSNKINAIKNSIGNFSLSSMTYKQCDSQRSNKQVYDRQNPQQIIHPFHNPESSRQFTNFVPQIKRQQKSSLVENYIEKVNIQTLTKSCLEAHNTTPKKTKQHEKILTSVFSCNCSEVKQSKIKLESKVIDVVYVPTPSLSFKKKNKKNIESEKYLAKYENMKKQELLQSSGSEERINGFIRGKMPLFLKKKQKKQMKSNRSISFQKKSPRKILSKNPQLIMQSIKSSPALQQSNHSFTRIHKQVYIGEYYSQSYFTSPTIYHNYHIYPQNQGMAQNKGRVISPMYRKN